MVLRAHGTWWTGNPLVRHPPRLARSSMRRIFINSECKAAHPPTIPSFGGFLSRQMLGYGPTLMVLSSDLTALVVDLSLLLMLGISLGSSGPGYLFFTIKHTDHHVDSCASQVRHSCTNDPSLFSPLYIQHLVVVVNSQLCICLKCVFMQHFSPNA